MPECGCATLYLPPVEATIGRLRNWWPAAAALAAALAISACADREPGAAGAATAGRTTTASPSERAPSEPLEVLQPSEGFAVGEVGLRGDGREIRMPVLVADEPPLRNRGLMFREQLPADAGMLFVFEKVHRGSFWMKDTLIPLSIAFAREDGTIVALLDMQPCTADPCELYDPGVSYRYALEVNQGFFRAHNINPGDKMQVPVQVDSEVVIPAGMPVVGGRK